jgi:hypothetical protein
VEGAVVRLQAVKLILHTTAAVCRYRQKVGGWQRASVCLVTYFYMRPAWPALAVLNAVAVC